MYEKIFATIYDPVMHNLENKFLREKRKTLLKDLQSPVLEIGFGTGANLDFYPNTIELYAIDKSPYMLEKFKKKIDGKSIHSYAFQERIDKNLNLNKLPKFSSIVSTLTLCSVQNLEKALKNIYDLLKPNGIFFVLEHIHSKTKIYGTLQNIISPFWKLIGDGCHINRKTDEEIKKFFYPDYEEYFFYGMDFYLARLKKK
ncbi:MAG: class I SAM-dependent methyltransferase [Leptonema sp. (in: bacteria)]